MKVNSHIQNALPLGELLHSKGFEVAYSSDIPLSKEEWKQLEDLTEEEHLPYFKVNQGDTEEDLSAHVFRIKITKQEQIYHEKLMNIVGSTKMLNFYRTICRNKKLMIDRCQAHLYKQGDFISRHIDSDSYQGYLYSLLFATSKDFTGGEMVIYNDEAAHKFKIQQRTLLLSSSHIPHEVLPVKSGIRKTLAIFLMEPNS